MSVFPLRATMDGTRNSEVLTLRNGDKQPMLVQPTVLQWSQKDGKEVLEPTRDLLISPALVEIQPGETQVVRVALRRSADPSRELSYRVVLKEVPRPSATKESTLFIALNISLPVFVLPSAGEAKGALQVMSSQWEDVAGKEMLRLALRNPGNGHVQIKKFAISDTSTALGEYNSMFYILPGETYTVRIPLARKVSSKSVRFEAQTDAGSIGQEFKIP